jgi:hypothetical protein
MSTTRFGLNYAGQSNQAWPQLRHQYQQSSVTRTEPRTTRCTPEGNIELVPERQVLDLDPTLHGAFASGKCDANIGFLDHVLGLVVIVQHRVCQRLWL